jgi:hypothetical protein
LKTRVAQAAAAVALEMEAGEKSFYYPMFRYLTRRTAAFSCSAHCTDDDLGALRKLGVESVAGGVEWERARWRVGASMCAVDYELFAKGAEVIASRAFWTSARRIAGEIVSIGDDEKNVDVVVPLIDLVNHRHDASNVYYWSDDSNMLQWWPGNVPVRAGEEIFDTYGQKGSSELFTSYGFVEERSPHDWIALELANDAYCCFRV